MKPLHVTLGLCALLAAQGCEKKPEQYANAAASAEKKLEEKKAQGDKAPKEIEGKKLNAFFPETLEDAKRTFTTEKDGFVEAKYQKDGTEVLTLTIADISDNPDSKTKFGTSTEKVGDYPVATFGKKQTMALVKDRYQVKVTSDALPHDRRKALLEKLDLKGVAAL
jgi:hypothetical protein